MLISKLTSFDENFRKLMKFDQLKTHLICHFFFI